MKALVFRGIRQIRVEEVSEPEPAPGEVLIRVAHCGICGSDLHGYLGHSPRRTRSIPLVMGHEFSGRVIRGGPGAEGRFAPGTRVTVNPVVSCGLCRSCRAGKRHLCLKMSILGIEAAGAFAPLVSVPADRVFPISDALSDATATLVETLAVEVHVFREMALALPRSVLVLGAGAQGLLAVQLARTMSIPEILVSDIVPERLELARSLGARTFNPREGDLQQEIQRRTDGWGMELAIETTGAPAARRQGIEALAPGGTLGVVGLGEGETTIDFLPVVNRELNIRGSYCYTDDDFIRSIELLSSGQVDGEPLLKEAPLESGPEAFARLIDSPGGEVKVLLTPGV